jgi:hypothetical protein
MGCDEVVLANLVGPLALTLTAPQTNLLVNRYGSFGVVIAGRASQVQWSFGDGTAVIDSGAGVGHVWTSPGDFFVTSTAYNTDHPGGVSTNLLVHVLPVLSPQLQPAGIVSNAFQFQFTGQATATYYIQVATNLAPPANWRTLQTIYYSTGGVYQISDAVVATNAARFYRVQAQ